MTLSVIIPVLDEWAGLPETVQQVQASLLGAEIVVADGGGSDGT